MTTSRARRATAACLSAAALFTATACGGGAAGGSANGSGLSGGSGTASSAPLSKGSFVGAVEKATQAYHSAHVTMAVKGAQSLTAQGDVDYDAKQPVMRLTMSGASLGTSKAEVRLVGGKLYLCVPPMTPRGKFVAIDPSDPQDPLGASVGSLTDQLDPTAQFAVFEKGLESVHYVGKDPVQGEQMDHYRLSVDTKAAMQEQSPGATGKIPGLGKTITYDVWLDSEHRMRQLEADVAGTHLTTEISEWGEHVEVSPPPASKVMTSPGSSFG